MKRRKKPALRFKGFVNDWEQRKLVDIATMHARIGWQNLRTSEFLDDGDYYLITGTDFKDGRIDFSSCHYVAKERYDQDKNIQIHNGSILITKDGTLGKVAYINGLNKPATLNAGVFNVVIKANDVDEKYLYHYLAGPFLMDYVSKRATGGTIKHLNQNILVDFPVVLPSYYDEQKKIGETLQDLDDLITLHQRKLKKLQNLKKAMLEKMFPKNGAKIPEIRFKGFTDDWEQRKLGNECFEIVAGGDVDKTKLLQDGKYPVIANALTDEGIIGYYANEYRIKAPAVTVTGRGDVGHARARKINFTPVVRLLSVISKHDVDFLAEAIDQNDIVLESTGVPQLTVPALANYLLCFPPMVKEEKRIGQYFSQLNHLITLHQRKLEKLQNLKKAMLEKMFI